MQKWLLSSDSPDLIKFVVNPTTASRTVKIDNLTAPYDALVEWGDGTTSQITSSAGASHTYDANLTYQITIRGRLGGFWNSSSPSKGADIVTSVTMLSSGSLVSLAYTFRECTALRSIPAEIDLPACRNFTHAFYRCHRIESALPQLWSSYSNVSAHNECMTFCYLSWYGQYSTSCTRRKFVEGVAATTYYQKFGTTCEGARFVAATTASTYWKTYSTSCVHRKEVKDASTCWVKLGTDCPNRKAVAATDGKSYWQQFGTNCTERRTRLGPTTSVRAYDDMQRTGKTCQYRKSGTGTGKTMWALHGQSCPNRKTSTTTTQIMMYSSTGGGYKCPRNAGYRSMHDQYYAIGAPSQGKDCKNVVFELIAGVMQDVCGLRSAGTKLVESIPGGGSYYKCGRDGTQGMRHCLQGVYDINVDYSKCRDKPVACSKETCPVVHGTTSTTTTACSSTGSTCAESACSVKEGSVPAGKYACTYNNANVECTSANCGLTLTTASTETYCRTPSESGAVSPDYRCLESACRCMYSNPAVATTRCTDPAASGTSVCSATCRKTYTNLLETATWYTMYGDRCDYNKTKTTTTSQQVMTADGGCANKCRYWKKNVEKYANLSSTKESYVCPSCGKKAERDIPYRNYERFCEHSSIAGDDLSDLMYRCQNCGTFHTVRRKYTATYMKRTCTTTDTSSATTRYCAASSNSGVSSCSSLCSYRFVTTLPEPKYACSASANSGVEECSSRCGYVLGKTVKAHHDCKYSAASGTTECNDSCTRKLEDAKPSYHRCETSGSECPGADCPYPLKNESTFRPNKDHGWA